MADGKSGRNGKIKFKKPPALIYSAAALVMSVKFRTAYGFTVDRGDFAGHRGPAVILATHTSGQDHILSGLALWPERPTFVLSEHFMTTPLLRRVLTAMHTIPKKMFCPDTRAVLRIIKAVRAGNTVVLFPEGRLTWHGRSLRVTDGTAELVKKLGVDVFSLCSDGAGKSFPKWSKTPRHGKIRTRIERLFTPEQLKEMSVGQINEKICAAIAHDEFRAMKGVRYRCKDTAEGLDGLLWKCPSCGGTHSLRCGNGHVTCEDCGLDASIDEYGYVSGTEVEYGIATVADWYDMCVSTIDVSRPLVTECAVSTTDGNGFIMKDCGEGTLSVGPDVISFKGTVAGEEKDVKLKTSDVKAFPVTLSDHVDIYIDGRLHLFKPLPDPRDAVVLAAYMDKLSAER